VVKPLIGRLALGLRQCLFRLQQSSMMIMSPSRPTGTPPAEVATLRRVSISGCLALTKDGAR
jgi:hypothetical protein